MLRWTLGVDINTPASESLAILTAVSISQLLSICNDLYREATTRSLTTIGDELYQGDPLANLP